MERLLIILGLVLAAVAAFFLWFLFSRIIPLQERAQVRQLAPAFIADVITTVVLFGISLVALLWCALSTGGDGRLPEGDYYELFRWVAIPSICISTLLWIIFIWCLFKRSFRGGFLFLAVITGIYVMLFVYVGPLLLPPPERTTSWNGFRP